MLFRNLNLKNKDSVKKSMGITDEDINNFLNRFNNLVIENNSKTIALSKLDIMNKKFEKVFCFLALVGYQIYIDKKVNDLNNLEN